MDVGQLLPFISGYRKATGEAKTSQGKINAFLRKANEDLRQLIEDATPALFYLDTKVYLDACQDFANNLRNPSSSTRQYIASVEYEGTNVYRSESDFEKAIQQALARYALPNLNISELSSKIANKQHSLEEFSVPLTRTFDLINKQVARYASDIAAGNATAQGRLRYAVTAAGRKTRSDFAKLTPCKLLNPELIVVGFNPRTQNLFLGVSFSTIRAAVNSVITPLIVESFKRAGINLADKNSEKSKNMSPADINKRFTIGEIVVFGHTGAKYTDSSGATEVLGFVTPWVQQMMLLAAQNSTAAAGVDIVNQFVTTSGQLEYSVEFTKQVSEGVRTLMQGQLAVIVPMSASLNKEILQGETRAAEQIVKNIFGPDMTYRKLRASLIGNVLQAANLRRLFTGLKFSPTLLESITLGIVETIKTGKFKDTPKTRSGTAKQTVKVSSAITKAVKKSVSKIRLPTATAKPISRTVPKPQVIIESNLTNLQNLLNGFLVEQVKKNMGTGNSRSVLNLRTGRFAESVKVERLSESRAGMITAFYSYMKNPYATFSQGGRQQNPASRDPKLLIARSIREIAQQQVQNRLRAVNV